MSWRCISLGHREQKPVVEIYFADRVTEAHRILIDQYNSRPYRFD